MLFSVMPTIGLHFQCCGCWTHEHFDEQKWNIAQKCLLGFFSLSLIDASALHDLFLSFGVFAAVLHLVKASVHVVKWPFINFIIANYIVWRIIWCFHIFKFHKGGQTSYKASILPSQRCCHDNRARHSRPPRDGEKERKWKDVEGRCKMMRKLKHSNETG